jgi:hypothetical protein
VSLKPTCTVTLGNLKYDAHISALSASLTTLPGVNQVRFGLPAGVSIEALPGDAATVELDGGEGSQTVLTGKVQGLSHHFHETEVWLADGGAMLSALHPAATYEKQAADEIVRALGSEAGVDVGEVDLDLPLAVYVAGQERSAAEHIAYLASLGGGVASFNAEGTLDIHQWPSGQADLALLYGREIIACQARQSPPPTQQVVLGYGPAGAADAPNALRHSLKPLPENAPSPGKDAIWRSVPLLRTPQAVKTASQGLNQALGAASNRVHCQAFLLPQLRPGLVVEIQEAPTPVEGPWLIQRVSHRISPIGAAMTYFDGVSAGESGSLLGDLLSAIGGLL